MGTYAKNQRKMFDKLLERIENAKVFRVRDCITDNTLLGENDCSDERTIFYFDNLKLDHTVRNRTKNSYSIYIFYKNSEIGHLTDYNEGKEWSIELFDTINATIDRFKEQHVAEFMGE